MEANYKVEGRSSVKDWCHLI